MRENPVVIPSPNPSVVLTFLCNLEYRLPTTSQAMPEQTIKTNREILDRMVQILEQQKELIELFKQTHNKDYMSQYDILSAEFHQLRKSLKDPRNLTGM